MCNHVINAYAEKCNNGKTVLTFDVSIPTEACDKMSYYYGDLAQSPIAIIVTQKIKKKEIKCVLSYDFWVHLSSLVNMTYRYSDSRSFPVWNWQNKSAYDCMTTTTTDVYGAICVFRRQKLSFEQQIVCRQLANYDCCCLPAHVVDTVSVYKQGIETAQREIKEQGSTKIPALTYQSDTTQFKLTYIPMHGQNERYEPWELQLAYRAEPTQKPTKGLPITMHHSHLVELVNKVDQAISDAIYR